MELLDRVAKRFGYTKPLPVAPEEAKAAPVMNNAQLISAVMTALSDGVAPEKSYAQLVEAYKSWVYTSIDKIAKTVAMLPLHLYVYRRQGGQKVLEPSGVRMALKQINTAGERQYALKQMGLKKEEVFDHPFLTLINHPNGIMSRMVLWYETLIRMELGGMCGWHLANNRLGLPAEIWPLPLTKTAELKPRITSALQIQDWVYTDQALRKTFLPQEILLLKYPNPASPFQGFSPLMAQTYPYDIDLFLMQQQRALFQNKGIPGIHMHTEQHLEPDQVKEVLEQLRAQWGSATRSGQPLVTHSGLSAEKSGWSNKDAMLTEVAKWAREKMITSYDLSEGKLGLVSDVNRANMEALDDTFVLECLKPKCMLIEEQIEAFLLPRYDAGLSCDFILPDTGNREYELKEEEMLLKNYVVVINEVRAKRGLDPKPWGERPWIPLGVMQEGTEPTPPEPPTPPKKELEEKGAAARARRWQQFVARTAGWERLIAGQMRGYFAHQKSEVIARLEHLGPRVEANYAGWSRKKMKEHIATKSRFDDINIDQRTEAARLKLMFRPAMTEMVDQGGGRILRELGASIMFNVNDPRVQKWLGTRLERFSEEVAGVTFDEIKKILNVGFSEGQPITAIADTLREKFDSYEKYRALMIARTEVVAATNQADILAITQAGIEDRVEKIWLTAGDENVRPTHEQAGRDYADGIPITEDFSVGGDEMSAPGNGSDPGENINCRCTMDYQKA